ncbi:MAG TPA: glycosyltransferase family 4 protein [Burkholderiales bacterium]|nr:glycosyltransferase family 4 protein [Burkholderiales bacterium]
MTLVFLTGSLVHGGAERHSITLANRLAERGHECHAVYVKDDPSQLERLRLAAPSSVRCLHARRYLDLAALSHLHAFLERVRPSVVHATNSYALLYGALARRGVPLAVTLHSTYLQTWKERLKMASCRPLFWSAQAAVFVCESGRRHWRRRGVFARRNAVIPNGVDLEHWRHDPAAGAATRAALGFAPGDFVVGLAAVLRPEKNPVQLVAALAELRRRGIPARALFIGDGPERARVEARAAELAVARHVTVTGLREDVRPFIAACDAMALTSFSEALSLAAIESMALGRPVVHPEVGGAAELITHGEDGFLFPVGDTATLVNALAFLSRPAFRAAMGQRSRAKVEACFSEHAMVERYEALLAELASTRRTHEQLRKRAPAHQGR